MTGDLSAAHQAGMSGLKMGAGIGAATGFAGGLKYSLDNKINPWTGKPNNSTLTTPSTLQWDLSPDPNGDNVTMYRGLSGNEGKEPLFFSKEPGLAPSDADYYGIQMVEITISRTTFI